MTESFPSQAKTDPDLSEDQKKQLSTHIFLDVLETVFETFDHAFKDSNATLNSEIAQLSQEKPLFLSDFAAAHSMNIIRTLEFSNSQKTYLLKHMQVHQQFDRNFCGYHTLYNMIEICRLLKSQDIHMSPQDILNPAKFWKFRFDCYRYLENYANMNGYDRSKYPWQNYHLQYGDFARAYVNPLTIENERFREIVSSKENFKISFITFEFQFNEVLLHSPESLQRMQGHIEEFIKAKDTPIHYLQMIMMGITNHWFVFFAHRYLDHVEFWMLDSKNLDYLVWSKEEICQFIIHTNEVRKKDGRPIINKFRSWVLQNAMIDTQTSINLLIDCFLGKTTLYHFVADSEVKMLAKGFIEIFAQDSDVDLLQHLKEIKDFLSKGKENNNQSELVDLIHKAEDYISAYHETLCATLNQKTNYLSFELKNLFGEIVSVLQSLLEHSENKQDKCINAFREALKIL